MHFKFTAIVALLLAIAVSNISAQRITATVRITKIPNVLGAFDDVQMFYDYGAKKLRFNYNLGPAGKPIEIFDFQEEVRYLGCGTTINCDAETYKVPSPIFHKIGTDTSGNSATPTCGTQAFNRATTYSTDVQYIALSANGQVCRAVLKSGKTYDFTNVANPASIAASTWDVSAWKCPAKVCNKQMDIMIVLDVSGSVADDWGTEQKFATDFVKSFTIGPNAVRVGLVTFDDTSKVEFGLLPDKTSIVNGINKADQRDGATCMGCGLRTARAQLDKEARSGVQRIIVLLSDGHNNRPECSGSDCNSLNTYLPNAITFAKRTPNRPIIFTVGVDQVSEDEMTDIASGTSGTYNGIKTFFKSPDFNGLKNILTNLVDATCIDLPGNPCGTGCRGFCACDTSCVCPDDCDTGNKCQASTCKSGINGNGCLTTTVNCNDNNACTVDSCTAVDGCKHDPVTCAPKKCFDVKCDSQAGCTYTAKKCAGDGDPCKNWYCDATSGSCTYGPRACDACGLQGLNKTTCSVGKSMCDDWNCKQLTSTTATCFNFGSTSCNDSNACTTDQCNAATGECEFQYICDDGDACTHDFCDPLTGCYHVAVNVTAECDDGTVCTIDSCNPATGCTNTPIVCEDYNPCTVDTCNSLDGCVFEPIDCFAQPEFAPLVGDCYMAVCNDGNNTMPDQVERPATMGCFLYQIPGTVISSCKKCGGDEAECFLGIGAEAAAGIGAGILALIIGGSAAAFLIVGGIAGKKGYDAYQRNKRDMFGAQNNALYQDSGRAGNNPFYANT